MSETLTFRGRKAQIRHELAEKLATHAVGQMIAADALACAVRALLDWRLGGGEAHRVAFVMSFDAEMFRFAGLSADVLDDAIRRLDDKPKASGGQP